MNICFLDYDGVVNTPMWNAKGTHCSYSVNNIVNNFQAVQWVSEFCQKNDFKIVVTSTWRFQPDYKECLIKGGLRDGVEIIGRTKHISGAKRGEEIKEWLTSHNDIDKYIIIDDDRDFLQSQLSHHVRTFSEVGFTLREYNRAVKMLKDGALDNI